MRICKLILLLYFLSSCSIHSQSLENLDGTFYVKNDSIVHSYSFNKGKLTVDLNLNDSFKVHFSYLYNYTYNDDKTLKVVLIDIKSEEIESSGKKKKKKSNSYIRDLYMMSGYFFSVWELEKIEENNLFIKVIPSSIKWPASEGHLANYYSGFEDHFVLQPIIKQ